MMGWLPALALLAGLTLAGLLAVPGRLDFIGAAKSPPDDTDVVVIVEGVPVTRGEIRQPVAWMRSFAPEFTEEELLKRTITDKVEQLLVRAEVRRRGLMPSLAEAREFMSTEREWCLAPDDLGAECREAHRAAGHDPLSDEYWEEALQEVYRYELGWRRLAEQLSDDWGNLPAGQWEVNEYGYLAEPKDPLLEEWRENAAIEWRDKPLERLYDHAVTGRPILRR